jgi:hypothetical protein
MDLETLQGKGACGQSAAATEVKDSAFGSQPPPFQGYERWNGLCDVNGDYCVGIDDIFQIATNSDGAYNLYLLTQRIQKTIKI